MLSAPPARHPARPACCRAACRRTRSSCVRARDRRLRLHVDGADPAASGLRTGHASTQSSHPVQSSTATWACAQVGKPAAGQRGRRKTFGRVGQPWIVVVARANRGVRAHHHAVSALDAQLWLPDRDAVGDIPLPSGRRRRVRAIHGERADWQLVAAPRDHHGRHLPDEIGRVRGHEGIGSRVLVAAGNATSCRFWSVRSTAAKLLSTTSFPLQA